MVQSLVIVKTSAWDLYDTTLAHMFAGCDLCDTAPAQHTR